MEVNKAQHKPTKLHSKTASAKDYHELITPIMKSCGWEEALTVSTLFLSLVFLIVLMPKAHGDVQHIKQMGSSYVREGKKFLMHTKVVFIR